MSQLAHRVIARFKAEFKNATNAGLLRLGEIISEEEMLAHGTSIRPPKPKRPRQSDMDDETWIKSLEGEGAFQGINIRLEIARCTAWYHQNVSKVGSPTRKRITNWLLKADKVLGLKSQGAQHATGLKPPPPSGPEGWRSWLQTEMLSISPEHPAHSQLTAAFLNSNFHLMPESWRARCRQAFTQPA